MSRVFLKIFWIFPKFFLPKKEKQPFARLLYREN